MHLSIKVCNYKRQNNDADISYVHVWLFKLSNLKDTFFNCQSLQIQCQNSSTFLKNNYKSIFRNQSQWMHDTKI